jgi:hypothetical protein
MSILIVTSNHFLPYIFNCLLLSDFFLKAKKPCNFKFQMDRETSKLSSIPNLQTNCGRDKASHGDYSLSTWDSTLWSFVSKIDWSHSR